MLLKAEVEEESELSHFSSEDIDRLEILDWDVLSVLKSLEKPADTMSFLDDLIDTFIRESPAAIKAVVEAVKTRSPSTVKHSAHHLKGLSSNMGIRKLAAIAEHVEIEAERARFPEPGFLKQSLEFYRQEAVKELSLQWKR